MSSFASAGPPAALLQCHALRSLAAPGGTTASAGDAQAGSGDKSGRLLENLALHPQRLVLTTQSRELLPLVRAQAVRAFALVTLGLLDPVTRVTSEIPRSSAI
jgi:hypothetical protein